MDLILELIIYSGERVWATLLGNWPFLLVSIVIAAMLKLFLEVERVSYFMNRFKAAGVAAATTAAVATPLCSCGTTAVVLGMMASTLPWGPILAFMVASPLTSPQELVYSAGLFGWPFALAFFLASILLGLAGGMLGGVLESRGWLDNQARLSAGSQPAMACPPKHSPSLELIPVLSLEGATFTPAPAGAACQCSQPAAEVSLAGSAGVSGVNSCAVEGSGGRSGAVKSRVSLALVLKELFTSGRRLLLMFAAFTFIGYFLNGLIPDSWVPALFGSGSAYSVPLAATAGLPFYLNTEASLPLVRSLLDAGMSEGAALAFLISGAGTSIGAIAGALAIARWRVVGLVVVTLWSGGIVSGWLYNLVLALGVL
jgi:uncharacterized protein